MTPQDNPDAVPEGFGSTTWVWHDPAHFKRPVPRPPAAWWRRLWNFTKALAEVAMAGASQQGGDVSPRGTGVGPAWMSWQEMRDGPEGPGVAAGSGFDMSSIDRELTATFRGYFTDSELSQSAFETLVRCESTLARVAPTLSGRDRQYFAMARAIARGILEQVTEDRPPWAAG